MNEQSQLKRDGFFFPKDKDRWKLYDTAHFFHTLIKLLLGKLPKSHSSNLLIKITYWLSSLCGRSQKNDIVICKYISSSS